MEELFVVDNIVEKCYYNICEYYNINCEILMQILMQQQKKTIKKYKKINR